MSAFFTVGTYYLSDPNNPATGRRVNAETGDPLTANVYYVSSIKGADESPRPLSIGQLVMAICLARATELESKIISKMEAMAETTLQLETLTGIQETIVNNPVNDNLTLDHTYDISDWPMDWKGGTTLNNWSDLGPFLKAAPEDGGAGCKGLPDTGTPSPEEVISSISSRLDSLNTVSQEDMIELQSLTNKRDQSYDLITNVLKSFNTVLTSIARNTLR